MKSIDYDRIVIEVQKENESLGSISISKNDLDTMRNMHGHYFKDIIGDMAETLREEIIARVVMEHIENQESTDEK